MSKKLQQEAKALASNCDETIIDVETKEIRPERNYAEQKAKNCLMFSFCVFCPNCSGKF